MGRFNLIAVRVVGVSLLIFVFLSMGSFENARAADTSDETQPPSHPPEAKRPLAVLDAPNPGETLVWFFPSDNNGTATVMYLLNTDTVAHIVALRGYSFNGVKNYTLDINVGATSMVRLSSDSIAPNPPLSWLGESQGGAAGSPAPIITNFTDFTYFASLSLPKGVKVDGYIVFNPTGYVDPSADQGATPLRFMTSPFYLP
jgi:hypothetical protein